MEFPTDAKFSNVELAPNIGASGLLYVPVKNIYSEFGDAVTLNSVFDIHPDISGSIYRKEPILRYNKLRETWEINPYFLESNSISASGGTVPSQTDIEDTNIPIEQEDTPPDSIPDEDITGETNPLKIVVTGLDESFYFESFYLKLNEYTSRNVAVQVNNTTESQIEVTVSLDDNAYVKLKGNNTPLIFEQNKQSIRYFTIQQKTGINKNSFTNDLNDTINITLRSVSFDDVKASMDILYNQEAGLTSLYTIDFNEDFFDSNFILSSSTLVSADVPITITNTSVLDMNITTAVGDNNNVELTTDDLGFYNFIIPARTTATRIIQIKQIDNAPLLSTGGFEEVSFRFTSEDFSLDATKTLTVIYEIIQVPNIILREGPFITGKFELSKDGTASDSFKVTLSKVFSQDINLSISISSSDYVDISPKELSFLADELTTKTITIFQTAGVELDGNIGESLIMTFEENTTSVGVETVTQTLNITYTHVDSPELPGAYITFNDNFSSTNFEDVNSALVPAVINNFSGFRQNDILYVLYKGTFLNLEPAVTDSDGQIWKIICKDMITVQAENAYVLMQIRGITILASSGHLAIADLRFMILRDGIFYQLNTLDGASGLTTYLEVNGISATFEENLINGTIEMGNAEFFYRFEDTLVLSEFKLPSSDSDTSALLMMRKGMIKSSVSMIPSSSNSLIDNNIYSSEVIDSWMQFDENNFANPVAFFSTVKMSGNVIITPGDMLAAYVVDSLGNYEIRGVSSTDYTSTSGMGVIPWTYPGESSPVNVLETTIFTNALQSTEFIKFRLFKKEPYVLEGIIVLAGNSVYELAQELPVGGLNGLTGGMYSQGPNDSNIFFIGRFTTVLNGPYDDFSFNVTMDDMKKEGIFVDGTTSQLNKIKAYRSQNYTAVQISPGIWLSNTTLDGALFVNSPLSYKEFYSIRLMSNVDKVQINLDGVPVQTQVSINLNRGYNWVGYTMFKAETLSNIFKLNGNTRLDPANSLKAIITRDQGSALVSNGGFFGSLSQMRPGGAYVLYVDPSLPDGTSITLNYPSTYNTTTVQNPSGFFKVTSFVNPLPDIIGDTYIFISDTEFGIAFVNLYNNTVAGIKTIGNYTGFGVHDTTMTLIDPQTIEIGNLGSFIPSFTGLDGILTSVQVKAGFTALDGTNIDAANGILDFVLRKNPNPLAFSDTEAVDYKLSEIGGLLPSAQSPPFKFTAVVDQNIPDSVQTFFGNFTPVIPSTPQNPVVFQMTKLENNKLQIQINLRKIIGSNENSKFTVIELFFDTVNFGEADNESDIPAATTDNVSIISPQLIPFSILQAQGNAFQYISVDGVSFGNSPLVFEVAYITASDNILIKTNSYVIDSNFAKYTIPEFL
mgnify:CR=1 FL=1